MLSTQPHRCPNSLRPYNLHKYVNHHHPSSHVFVGASIIFNKPERRWSRDNKRGSNWWNAGWIPIINQHYLSSWCAFLSSNAPRTTPSCPEKREGGSRYQWYPVIPLSPCLDLPWLPYEYGTEMLPKFYYDRYFILPNKPWAARQSEWPNSRPKCSAPRNSPRHEWMLHPVHSI